MKRVRSCEVCGEEAYYRKEKIVPWGRHGRVDQAYLCMDHACDLARTTRDRVTLIPLPRVVDDLRTPPPVTAGEQIAWVM